MSSHSAFTAQNIFFGNIPHVIAYYITDLITTHKRHSLAHPHGRIVECLLWVLRRKVFVVLNGFGVVVHYSDVIMDTVASQITSLSIVYSTVYSDADQRKHKSSASLAFVRGIHRGPVNSPHKWPVTRKMFPFDDVIMSLPHLEKQYHFSLLSH